MQITEPVTMLTDYALGLLTLLWATRLFERNDGDRPLSRTLWALGFIATSAASFLGGSFHGFRSYLTESAATVLWKTTLYSIGIASWVILSAIVVACAESRWRRSFLIVAAAKFLLFALWMTGHSEFRYVIYDYVLSMVAILVVQSYTWFSRQSRTSAWIISGILVGFLAAAMQNSRYSIHAYFNHNDLFHVVQMVGFYLLYRGGQLLRDSQ